MGRIHFERDGHIAHIVLDHPEKMNSVDATMSGQLSEAYEEVVADDAIRVAVISGAGDRAFSTGGYIPSYVDGGVVGPEGSGVRTPLPKPWPIWKPFIAAIRGYAVGGGFGLALACDLRIAAHDATLGPSGLRRGVIQGAQQTQRLIRLVSYSKAMEMLLLSKYVRGREAAEIGLVQRVESGEDVLPAAMEWAGIIASYDPWAVQTTKRLAYRGLPLDLQTAFDWEEEMTVASYKRPAAQEGFSAFVEDRDAEFGDAE